MPWAPNYSSALKAVRATGKLMLIDFYADWCSWCKRMDSSTFSQKTVTSLCTQVVPVRLDADKDGKSLATQYGVKSLPRVILIDAQGVVWCSVQGYLPPETFATEIKKGLDAKAQYPRACQVLRKSKSDPQALAVVAFVEAQRGRLSNSAAFLKHCEDSKFRGKRVAAALNAFGEAHFRNRAEGIAAEFFRAAERTSIEPYESAYAALSLAFCLQKTGDVAAARQACKRVVQAKDAPREFVAMAMDLLRQSSEKGQ